MKTSVLISRILCLLARTSVMKTSVLISSIFFIADSVVSGYLMVRYLSNLTSFGTDLFGALGLRGVMRVFGRKKCTFVRTFLAFFVTPPLTPAAVFFALTEASAFAFPFATIVPLPLSLQ